MYGDPVSDPESFGQDVADFDIGEPLGTVAKSLRRDDHGVSWWGELAEQLPTLPDSPRLLQAIAAANEEHRRRREWRDALNR